MPGPAMSQEHATAAGGTGGAGNATTTKIAGAARSTRVAGAPRPLLLLDVGAAVLIGGGLLYANSRSVVDPSNTAESVVRITGTVIAAASVALRRLDARWAMMVATLSAGGVCAFGGAPMVSLCIALTAYSAATAGEYRRWWVPPAAAGVVVAAGVAIGQVASWVAALIATVAVVCVGWFAGQAARERRNRLVTTAEQQAERARQHTAELRQAAVDERLVIARELHDIVAHAMSVIAVRAGVARVVMDTDPVEVKETLGIIETTTRQALHEMRLLVSVLRHEGPSDTALAPAPGLADIGALVEQIRRAGVDVQLDYAGQPRDLPPGVDLSAYRIAQEALTNVVRHAGRTRATLRIEYRADDLLIDVTDAGPTGAPEALIGAPEAETGVPSSPGGTPAPAPHAQAGAGHGLIGMGERVALFDGQLRTGRHRDGYRVNAVLRTDQGVG